MKSVLGVALLSIVTLVASIPALNGPISAELQDHDLAIRDDPDADPDANPTPPPNPEPFPDAFYVTTFAGKGCTGKNQGTTNVRKATVGCIKMQYAQSFKIHPVSDACCTQFTAHWHHNYQCSSTPYFEHVYDMYGCKELGWVPKPHDIMGIYCSGNCDNP